MPENVRDEQNVDGTHGEKKHKDNGLDEDWKTLSPGSQNEPSPRL